MRQLMQDSCSSRIRGDGKISSTEVNSSVQCFLPDKDCITEIPKVGTSGAAGLGHV